MNSTQIKAQVVKEISETAAQGARLSACCAMLGISLRTFERWRSPKADGRKGSWRVTANKLTPEERKEVISVSCSERFQNDYPSEIVAKLASEGVYIASEATFYRILNEERLLAHRRPSRVPVKREKPRLTATGPDQVYSWDITWLKSPVSGIYFYLYLVLDIFSRRIVHWEIHTRESGEIASEMLRTVGAKRFVRGITLHSDNGSPMKGYTMLATMQQLGVIPSYSRPRVSTDNPYSESLFRTLKYRPFYPSHFESIEETKVWTEKFVHWYNHQHLHSGISFVTPHDRHYGKDKTILEVRRQTYQKAYDRNPLRWTGQPKAWVRQEVVYINKIDENKELQLAS